MSDEELMIDYAEPEPDTIGQASRTAKCHHCGGRIREADDWVHVESGSDQCPTDPKEGE